MLLPNEFVILTEKDIKIISILIEELSLDSPNGKEALKLGLTDLTYKVNKFLGKYEEV